MFSSVFTGIGVLAVIYVIIRQITKSKAEKAYYSGYSAGRQGQAPGEIKNKAFYASADKLGVYRNGTEHYFCDGYEDGLQEKLPQPPSCR